MGAISDNVCKPCEIGKYAPTTASTQCQECPPDHIAQTQPHLNTYQTTLVAISTANHASKALIKKNLGSAYCDACPVGKYLDMDGAVEVSLCKNCPIGKYGNTQGLAECLQCPNGQYQDALGATICKSCKSLGKVMTNNPEFTGCKVDETLVNEELINMFNKGVALSVSFSISAVFVFICGFMQMKERSSTRIHRSNK